MAMAIGGKFASKGMAITEAEENYLIDNDLYILADEHGALLFVWEESERFIPERSRSYGERRIT